MKFLEDSKQLRFKEDTHQYFYADQELISVTQFIKLFANKFDEDGSILKRCAEKRGISEKKLKKEWNNKGEKAGKIGTKIHEGIEHFIDTGKIRKNKYTPIFQHFKDNFKFKGKLYSECLLFDSDLSIAGTSDLVQIIDDKIVQVHDIKTNEKQPSDYSFGKRMQHPLEHLNDSKLTHYFLQISIYLYILSSKYGFQIGNNNFIFWINRKKEEIVKIPVDLKMDEVTNMFSHFLYCKSLTPEQLEELKNKQDKEEWID